MKSDMATHNQRLVQGMGCWNRSSIRYSLLLCTCSTLISLAGVPILSPPFPCLCSTQRSRWPGM